MKSTTLRNENGILTKFRKVFDFKGVFQEKFRKVIDFKGVFLGPFLGKNFNEIKYLTKYTLF